ncbi:MAG: hypothetical protein A2W90_21485 [Bacteroidetes bacterium GWF2_42_66]|nr:MAG: hypothetical protein A2W92_04300 [Bacteroidetes bacterium GWA2_42_15]OFX98907.1 MAG: hypothetical protein A2W89_13120 [Bacteroidetes bacterium GWE2_42_39]OFY45622.1 MAG: hypothetical protein A2W90_21485 [Bacteroidetes bacterium GWF2_42_66]HBL77398.1 hypothetical protein [Prolixibacteraceae bacterium]HCU62438.1 hypothetical protein [Prolixibacteraceae bacterium]
MKTEDIKEIKVLICEDEPEHLTDIKLYLAEFAKSNEIKIVCFDVNFTNYHSELHKEYDLLILDFFDKSKEKGETVLSHNESNKRIKTLIYSAKIVDYDSLSKKYSCLVGHKPKLQTGDNLKEFLLSFLFREDLIRKNYNLHNNDDIFLLADIRSIGEKYLNELIHKISIKEQASDTYIIKRMTSGLSGAFVLKLLLGNTVEVLKISKEVTKLKLEHSNANRKYQLFPSRLIIPIKDEEFESNDKKVYAILIKEVNDAITLFDFIKSNKNTSLIENVLNDLFIGTYSLQEHYLKNKDSKCNWDLIFIKIDKYKFILIERAFEELKSLMSSSINFNITEIKNLVVDKHYLLMDIAKTTDKLIKESVLCHGDFHSKNILVQGSHPVIIDTGSIDYLHWSSDLCRLIVDLFISGFDINTKEFYDINQIEPSIEIVKLIINQTNIPLDNKNDNFIFAINWLMKNCSSIYAGYYTVFEYQLGLMKEFLQISYRVATVPPNKRAIALIAAYLCMKQANESIKNLP